MTSRLSPPSVRSGEPFVGFAHAADAAVRELNRQLPGIGLWLVTCVVEDRQLVVASAGDWAERAPAGTEFSWQASLCLRMVNGAPQMAMDLASEPAYRSAMVGPLADVRAYLGLPLRIADGELFGTLCAFAGTPQPLGWSEVLPVASLVGRMLSTVLVGERAARDRSVEAARAYALADRDPLTELRNRRGFEHAVHTEQGRGLRFGTRSSILVMTLDPSSDGLAAAPDALLGRCAQVLSTLCQSGDLAARVQSREFALLAAETDLVGVRAMQVRLRQALRKVDMGASVGTASRRVGEDLAETWTRAEQATRADERRRTPGLRRPQRSTAR
jgi:GGDEF domain-containing protein